MSASRTELATEVPKQLSNWFSIEQAIEKTGLSRSTLYRAVKKKKLECYRVGRRVLFDLEQLQNYLNQYKVKVTQGA